MAQLDIKTANQLFPGPMPNGAISFMPARDAYQIFANIGAFYGQNINIGPLDVLTNTFPTLEDAVNYYYATGSAYVLSWMQTNYDPTLTMGIRLDGVSSEVHQNDELRQPVSPVLTGLSALPIVADTLSYTDSGGNIAQLGFTPDAQSLMSASMSAIKAALNVPTQASDINAVPTTRTVNGHALSSNVTVTKSDVNLGNVDNTSDLNKPVSTATQTALNGKFNTPTGTVAQYVAGDGSTASRSTSTPSRTVGTAFQVSTTRDAIVFYSIPATSNATLVAGSQVSATFRYADNSGMSTNVVTLPGDQFGIASGLLVSGIGSLKMMGIIPAGKWVQITTTNIAGTPTLGSMTAQEILL